jgi:N-acetylglutamate synthase-like GNAT family acetyltransferase
MTDYTLRPARESDARAIRDLIHAVQINPMGLDWRHFLVAVSPSDQLVGCGQIKLHRDGSCELASIAVQEWARGQGVARAVILALLEREGVRPLYLMCRARLGSLYAKFGFHPLEFESMPPYFKRIHRIANLMNRQASTDDQLLVMCLLKESE